MASADVSDLLAEAYAKCYSLTENESMLIILLSPDRGFEYYGKDCILRYYLPGEEAEI